MPPRTTRSSGANPPAVPSRRSGRQQEELPEGSWDVKSIRSKQIDYTGKVKYLVDWDNWSGPATWEPEENCLSCPDAIRNFEDKVARNRGSVSRSRLSSSPLGSAQRPAVRSGRSNNNDNNNNNNPLSGERSASGSPVPRSSRTGAALNRTPNEMSRLRRR